MKRTAVVPRVRKRTLTAAPGGQSIPCVVPSPEPVLETERLILRPPRREDFEGFAEMLGDEETTRYIGGRSPRAMAWRRFLQMPGAWMIQGFGMFSVIDRQTGEWLGQTGPWQPEGWPGTEVGWTFRRGAWGHGYACEAATAAIDWAFDNLGWVEVIHCINADNHRSQALARRLGSRVLRQASMPAPYDSGIVDVWGQSRGAWRAHRVSHTPRASA